MGKLIKISDYLKNKKREVSFTDEEIFLESFKKAYTDDEIRQSYENYLKNKGDEKNV